MAVKLVKQHRAWRHLQTREFAAEQSQALHSVVKVNVDSAIFDGTVTLFIRGRE